MTKQVADMVEKLKARDAMLKAARLEMQQASGEFCALLAGLARRVYELSEAAELNDLEALGKMYEEGAKHLEAFNQFVLDCETVIGLGRKKVG